MTVILTKQEAINFLGINQKYFENYYKNSGEIKAYKGKELGNGYTSNWWYFKKTDLEKWKKMKDSRTVVLSLPEYEKCFEFAIKMAYSFAGSHGTGIRGVRSEVQMADDFILGILAEHAVQKFIKDKFNTKIKLDTEVHHGRIVPQDFDGIMARGKWRNCKIGVAVKSSKMKSCFNIIPPIEYENGRRKSDVYIFVRVGLPSDHLFRILRDHSFFKNVSDFLEESDKFRKIKELKNIPMWICGFSYHKEFSKATSVPGLRFDNGYRYVKSVADMHNTDKDWKEFLRLL